MGPDDASGKRVEGAWLRVSGIVLHFVQVAHVFDETLEGDDVLLDARLFAGGGVAHGAVVEGMGTGTREWSMYWVGYGTVHGRSVCVWCGAEASRVLRCVVGVVEVVTAQQRTRLRSCRTRTWQACRGQVG